MTTEQKLRHLLRCMEAERDRQEMKRRAGL